MTATGAATALWRRAAARPRWRWAAPQLTVMAAQWTAGLANLVSAVVLARLLPAAEYASMAAFLGLYLLLSVPGAALSAAGAHDPSRLAAVRRRIAIGAVALGGVLVGTSGALAARTDASTVMLVSLGLAAPAAVLLGIGRGLAYGRRDHRRVASSLIAEAGVRLVVGTAAAAAAGASGAAVATTVAGYAALVVVTRRPAGAPAAPALSLAAEPRDHGPGILATATPFFLVAVLQTADLLVAHRVLDHDDAAAFGVLSTIGGAAVFATATVPLVLLPALRRREGERSDTGATATATGLTAVVGLGVAAVVGLTSATMVSLTFGDQYASIARFVGPYLLAMAVLAIVRVRLAVLVTVRPVWAAAALTAAIAVEVLAIAFVARTPGAVVATTLATTATLGVVLELPVLARVPAVRERLDAMRRAPGAATGMIALCAAAIAVRLATTRGLWVDEAISVRQAGLPFGDLLADVRTTDVHPPFHHAVLWLTVRVFGTSELAVRLPSLIAGVALVPVVAWVGRVIYDRRTGWVAAAMAAVAPFCVWYSQEARMYSQFMLFAALALGAQVLAVRRGLARDWALYAVATAAMLWTQYFALLPIAVQQLAFAVAWWTRRRAPGGRRLLGAWAASLLAVGVLLLPLLPILRDQLAAYGGRGAGLVPGQAGAGNSTIGDGISIYALGANLIWATLGYHADGVMVQLAALWPLLMLGALLLLGRGRSRASLLLVALIIVPLTALFAVGSLKRDLFELRYFSGAVPALVLLLARFVTATTRRRTSLVVAASVLVAAMSVGLVDQQINGANPRRYDFAGALERVQSAAGEGDVVRYEPSYLADVIEYYAPDLPSAPVGTPVPEDATVWVLSTDRVVNAEVSSARLGHELAALEREREIVDRFAVPNVLVWELQWKP